MLYQLGVLNAVIAILVNSIYCAPTPQPKGKPSARQYIPAQPGFIPVYIRNGDTPLEDINPDLAAAFDSYALKHNRFSFGRAINELKDDSPPSGEKVKEEGKIKNSPIVIKMEGDKKEDDENLDDLGDLNDDEPVLNLKADSKPVVPPVPGQIYVSIAAVPNGSQHIQKIPRH